MALIQATIYSHALQNHTKIQVILPQTARYDAPVKATASYPVLYLLHGLGDDHTTWCSRTSIETYVENTGIAVVMPTTARDWYVDTRDGIRWRTYIAEELPCICQELFPQISTKREDTFIAGQSMGGYGTLAIALNYPERFSAAAGLSGAYCPHELPDNLVTTQERLMGTPEEYAVNGNNLFAVSEKLAASGKEQPRLYMWCGTEDFLYLHNTAMRDHLYRLGWKEFLYEESPGGHSWELWDIQIQTVLKWLRGEHR